MSKDNKNMINMDGSDIPFYRYVMPSAQIKVEGTTKMIKTVLTNINAVADCCKRPPEYLVTFLGQEFSVNSKFDKDIDKFYISGKHDVLKVQNVIFKFIKDYVMCFKCKVPDTIPIVTGNKKNSTVSLKCRCCNFIKELDNSDRFVKFMVQHPVKIEEKDNYYHENNQQNINNNNQQNINNNQQNINNNQQNINNNQQNINNNQGNNIQNDKDLDQDIDIDDI